MKTVWPSQNVAGDVNTHQPTNVAPFWHYNCLFAFLYTVWVFTYIVNTQKIILTGIFTSRPLATYTSISVFHKTTNTICSVFTKILLQCNCCWFVDSNWAVEDLLTETVPEWQDSVLHGTTCVYLIFTFHQNLFHPCILLCSS